MEDDLAACAVLATFDDRIAAEVACALRGDASSDPDEPLLIAWGVDARQSAA
jgi:hypothetical protein